MRPFVSGCGRLYRRIARTFPDEFRAVCGDGLEQLGQDVVPLVWQQRGVVGLVRLFADLAVHVPYEYLSSLMGKLKEVTMSGDVFEGTWKARSDESHWDTGNPTPQQACVRFEATDTGYLMFAYGIVDGQAVAERPQAMNPDGRRRPLLDLSGRPIPSVPAGAVAFCSRPDPQTLHLGTEANGTILSAGTFNVSADGKTLTATNEGIGPRGPFKVVIVFERVASDPYVSQS